jgi:hypothetical protein
VDGIDHVDLVVSAMERSLPFYRELLAPLGYTDEGAIHGERGELVDERAEWLRAGRRDRERAGRVRLHARLARPLLLRSRRDPARDRYSASNQSNVRVTAFFQYL